MELIRFHWSKSTCKFGKLSQGVRSGNDLVTIEEEGYQISKLGKRVRNVANLVHLET